MKKKIKMDQRNTSAVLLLSCPDRIGLVSRISHFIFERGGNILSLNEHVDTDEKYFFMRVTWDMKNFSIEAADVEEAFMPLAKEFSASFQIRFFSQNLKAAIFVSKFDHCLQEILWRKRLGEFSIDIPVIISNHPDLEPLAAHHKIPFHIFPVTQENKFEQEKRELKLMKDYKVDTIILARYMQILSTQFVSNFPMRIINIHHSFLPAFIGGNPYRQAFKRGVKIIGATSHYVTESLDDGPIIEQDIVRISHKDKVEDLKRKGRDLERLVLARAIQYHAEHRILVHGNKTIVFN